ncbi:uncharacterized protein BDR25DRAFT_25096 [Lindgomyces ingoldianus]|uniref:Uncharacterized protein n=1 Tax=Lindgomyces ingoldianus TaxID=673940 RepID=A0ACB6QW66_9PLEO|nr:uncharacterized protein BDR25DRAFT_25096 [Lindgomyces ingoldianus]KAF2471264.1 hypothetical protein BDR25DRAFT_25096 [Lindgomyces ingoldianus]
MTDFAPPPGPPPPKAPKGWKVLWNDQYSEWFYVNIYTKKSQWDKPDEPVYPPGEAPDSPPPSARQSANDISEDERLARQLQDEEYARVSAHSAYGGDRGAADAYYTQGGPPQLGQYGYEHQQAIYPNSSQTAHKGKTKSGFLGKLLGKAAWESWSFSLNPAIRAIWTNYTRGVL